MVRGALPAWVPRRRVVVTGIGAVTPFGVSVAELWAGVLGSKSAATSTTNVPYFVPTSVSDERRLALCELLPCKVACCVQTPPALLGPKGQDPFAPTSSEPRYTRFAKTAATEALRDAGLLELLSAVKVGTSTQVDPRRVGCNVGVGMTPLADVADVGQLLYDPTNAPKYNRVSPFFVPKILANMVAGAIAIEHGLEGPNLSTVTACATGAHCIGDSARWIQLGKADIMVCGATEAAVNAIGIAGFARMRALSSKRNATPAEASRPFDQDRDGFVMGEGAGILVLESEESAINRGARIYAECRGYGATGDASHITTPREDGRGAKHAILAALEDGGIDAREVQYVNAHATSTPIGDSIELNAITEVMRQANRAADPVLVSSSKGHIGHLLGAAGAVEAIVALLAAHHGTAPPTCNLTNPIESDANFVSLVRGSPRQLAASSRVTLSTSFGFGGTNSALAFCQYP